MATFCMQTLGCEVSAIHTVNYSESRLRHAAVRSSLTLQAIMSDTGSSKATRPLRKKWRNCLPGSRTPTSTTSM